jgi:hypothetical protein
VGCAEKEQQSEGRAEVDDLCGKRKRTTLGVLVLKCNRTKQHKARWRGPAFCAPFTGMFNLHGQFRRKYLGAGNN